QVHGSRSSARVGGQGTAVAIDELRQGRETSGAAVEDAHRSGRGRRAAHGVYGGRGADSEVGAAVAVEVADGQRLAEVVLVAAEDLPGPADAGVDKHLPLPRGADGDVAETVAVEVAAGNRPAEL